MGLAAYPLLADLVLFVPVALVALGVTTTFVQMRHGGLRLALARMVLSAQRTWTFFVTLAVALLSLLMIGATEALAAIRPAWSPTLDLLELLVFAVGTGALLLMITLGLNNRPLTLREEFDLKAENPELLEALAREVAPGSLDPVAEMYVAPLFLRAPPSGSSFAVVTSSYGHLSESGAVPTER